MADLVEECPPMTESRRHGGLDPIAAPLFREAMSRIAAAVHVVTTDGPAGRAGATMTAVASVSDAPPTLLVCLNRAGRTGGILIANGVFCVNTLSDGDERLAGVFAGVGDLAPSERFAAAVWRRGISGAPRLDGARAALECRVTEAREVGSHQVIFGEVVAVTIAEPSPALVYLDRDYRSVDGVSARSPAGRPVLSRR
jgi:flavin reductase (DIM6/NTAB) family NADH-FMN oxidoreductase RutF